MSTIIEKFNQVKGQRMEELGRMDANADAAIKLAVGAIVLAAVIPTAFNWALIASAMGTLCVKIGNCYGFTFTAGQAKDLIKQFVYGAGFCFLSLNVGSKIFCALMECTGFGYIMGAAIDAAMSAAMVYAIGQSAKEYFHQLVLGRKISPKEIGATTFRRSFREYKAGMTE